MPSASAKIEKVASFEAADPVKQIAQMLEKRVRNLEKRKIKLDNYRMDVSNGKELNEDQKIAVSKYDEVVSLLEYTKELIKGLNLILIESMRQQKKLAKREQLERQQQEVQRLQEAFFHRHTLQRFAEGEVRQDFLNGDNGALPLSSEQLSQLDHLQRLLGGGSLPPEGSDLHHYCHALAENHIFLVEGRNKEVAGATYKALREVLQGIEACGYFSRAQEPTQQDPSEEEEEQEQESAPEEEPQEDSEHAPDSSNEPLETSDEEKPAPLDCPPEAPPLQEVLSPQGSFNFLQESQIDLDAPHMDPAVVAVHQMAPPAAVNFLYPPISPPAEDPKPVPNGTEVPQLTSPLPQVPLLHPAPLVCEFDPSHPIPSQTFTNQSFAVMQNMAYMAPIAVLPTPALLPMRVPANGAQPHEDEEAQPPTEETEAAETDPGTNDVHKKEHETNGYNPPYRGGGYRGRGCGRYFRGRNNYNRGGFQNHYYQDRNGYSSNYRRGGNNRGPRGSSGERGHFRPRAPQQSQPQAPQQPQALQQ